MGLSNQKVNSAVIYFVMLSGRAPAPRLLGRVRIIKEDMLGKICLAVVLTALSRREFIRNTPTVCKIINSSSRPAVECERS